MEQVPFVPYTLASTGASKIGWHFLASYRTCPMAWYNRYLRPHPAGGQGCEPLLTGENLLTGSAVHAGLAAYYTGQATSLDDLIEAGRQHLRGRTHEQTPAVLDKCSLTTDLLLEGYYRHWTSRDDVEVAQDIDGHPLVERELELNLGYRGYVFTGRLDLVAYWKGYLYSVEHKTTSVRGVSALKQRWAIDGQGTGQVWLLRSLYPELPTHGVLLNVLVKDRGQRSQHEPFQREPYTRTPLDLEKFEIDCRRTLRLIEENVDEYNDLLTKGLEPAEAARVVFHGSPDGYRCFDYGPCPYMTTCLAKGDEDKFFAVDFRPRAPAPTQDYRGRTD